MINATSSSSSVTIDVGSPLTLFCTSQGSPPDTFTWQKGGDQTVLQSTSVTAVDHTDTNAVFRAEYRFDIVTMDDNRTFTCTVTNPIGSNGFAITITTNGMYLKKYYLSILKLSCEQLL